MTTPAQPHAALDMETIKQHRTELARALDAAFKKRGEIENEIHRMTGAVAGMDLLLQKLAPAEPAATEKKP
jgi:hypothetical protein